MAYSIFNYENQFIHVHKGIINNIPYLKFSPKGMEGLLPTVIYYHGWHSSKEYKRFQASVIASYGFQVIVPDALHHGERDKIDHDAPHMLEQYLWKIIVQTVEESSEFIEGLIKNESVHPNRIAVMGSSMGGFSASGIFTQHKNVKCLVNINGASAWSKSEKTTDKRIPQLDPEIESNISFYDPVNQLHKIQQRPLLLIHGDADTSVPIEIERYFYEKAKPFYKENPEKLQLIEYPRMNHYTSTGMLENAIDWFKKYL